MRVPDRVGEFEGVPDRDELRDGVSDRDPDRDEVIEGVPDGDGVGEICNLRATPLPLSLPPLSLPLSLLLPPKLLPPLSLPLSLLLPPPSLTLLPSTTNVRLVVGDLVPLGERALVVLCVLDAVIDTVVDDTLLKGVVVKVLSG